jgi:hypothetical protein
MHIFVRSTYVLAYWSLVAVLHRVWLGGVFELVPFANFVRLHQKSQSPQRWLGHSLMSVECLYHLVYNDVPFLHSATIYWSLTFIQTAFVLVKVS